MRRRVAFLSNYRTVNLGNEALTRLLHDLLEQLYGAGSILGLHRLPHVYTGALPQPGTATWGNWDDWVDHELRAARSMKVDPDTVACSEVLVRLPGGDRAGDLHSRRRRAIHWLLHESPARVVPQRAARPQGRRQLAAMLTADEVIYNPAGEINPGATPLSRFFELAVAQRAGLPTAMVNFGYEPSPALRPAARMVLPRIDRIVVRGHHSIPLLVEDGAREEVIEVVPDAVFLAERGNVPPRDEAIVAVVASARLESAVVEPWARTVELLLAAHKRPRFVSNELQSDIAFAHRLAERAGPALEIESELYSHRDLITLLASFGGVVTSRLHTAVMAAVAGIPVRAVESPDTNRLRGALTEVGLDELLLDAGDPTWPEQAVSAVVGGPPVPESVLDGIRQRIRGSYEKIFPLDLGSKRRSEQ